MYDNERLACQKDGRRARAGGGEQRSRSPEVDGLGKRIEGPCPASPIGRRAKQRRSPGWHSTRLRGTRYEPVLCYQAKVIEVKLSRGGFLLFSGSV
jgi:hypothetical protein